MIEQFLQTVLGHTGEHYVQLIAKDDKHPLLGNVNKDLRVLAKWATALNNKKRSIYFTLVQYSEVDQSPKREGESENAWRGRRSCHTLVPRDFVVLDFDFKDQQVKWRSNPKALVTAVAEEIGKPHGVVLSGGGVHLYYYMKDPDMVIPTQIAVQRLFSAKQVELPVVDQRAGVAANDVLRLPYLDNHKRGKPVKLVYLKTRAEVTARDTLTDTSVLVPVKQGTKKKFLNRRRVQLNGTKPPVQKLSSRFTELAFVDDAADVLVSYQEVRQACYAFDKFVDDAENMYRRPDGSLVGATREDMLTAISVFKYSTHHKSAEMIDESKQFKIALPLLMNWPDETEEYVQTQFDSIKSYRGCETWGPEYTSKCDSCPYTLYRQGNSRTSKPTPYGAAVVKKTMDARNAANKQFTSTLLTPATVDTIENLVDVPSGYLVNDQGITFMDTKKMVQVTNVPFRVGRLAHEDTICLYIIPKLDDPILFTLHGSPQIVINKLQEIGIAPNTMPNDAVNKEATSKLVQYVRMSKDLCKHVPREDLGIGWRNSGKMFAFPEATYRVKGKDLTIKQLPPIPSALPHKPNYIVKPFADAGRWWHAINRVFFDNSEIMREKCLVLLASFASPLYSLYAKDSLGHTLNMCGKGNAGKSTTLHAAQSVWSNMDRFMITAGDTLMASLEEIANCGNLPAIFDDVLRSTGDGGYRAANGYISQMVHSISEGRSRKRLKTSFAVDNTTSFSLILISTSNDRMVDTVRAAGDAGMAALDRLTEFHMVDTTPAFAGRGISLNGLLRKHRSTYLNHGGSAGREFIQYLLPRVDKYRVVFNRHMQNLEHYGVHNRHPKTFRAAILTAQEILVDMGRIPESSAVSVFRHAKDAVHREKLSAKIIGDMQPTPEDVVEALADNIFRCKQGAKNLGLVVEMVPPNQRGSALWRWEDEVVNEEYIMITRAAVIQFLKTLGPLMGGLTYASVTRDWRARGFRVKPAVRQLPTATDVRVEVRGVVYTRKLV